MTNQKINLQKLIPTYWHGIIISTEEDLIFLGSMNLEYLKRYWRQEERRIVGEIKVVQSQIDMLDGKTVEDIKVMAAKYEHPQFPKIGVPEYGRTPEPLDDESVYREAGATTFNVCGWCKYCDGGWCRHNYHIVTTCSLIPVEFNNGGGSYGNDFFHFNTPCAINNGTQELLETCVAYLKSKLAGLVEKKTEISESVRLITNLTKRSEKKPYLASHRPTDWFKLGDEVVCFMPSNCKNAIKKGVFVTGKVIKGFRCTDGLVSLCTDEPVYPADFYNGCRVGCGMLRPEVMHRWEYEYLKSHPDYLKVWIRASSSFEFDPSEMTKAFRK